MSNEEIVALIKKDVNKQENLLTLYNQNLPMIKRIAKPYTTYEEEADLLQQSYFSLLEAVERYELDKEASFLTYLLIWVRQGIVRYIEDNGRVVRLPSFFVQRISKYKKFVADFITVNGRNPTVEEISQKLVLSPEQIEEVVLYAQQPTSLDKEVGIVDNDSFTLADTLTSPGDLEEEIVEGIYADYEKIALWEICQKYLSDNENTIIEERFRNEKTLQQIADQQGITRERVRKMEHKALSRLRRGKALRELKERLYVIENSTFNSSLRSYREHHFTSEVERRVLRLEEIKEEMKRRCDYIV